MLSSFTSSLILSLVILFFEKKDEDDVGLLNRTDSVETIFISIFYLTDRDTVIDIKRISKFKTKYALNKYEYEADIQQIQIF
jgi:hypothetical protein